MVPLIVRDRFGVEMAGQTQYNAAPFPCVFQLAKVLKSFSLLKPLQRIQLEGMIYYVIKSDNTCDEQKSYSTAMFSNLVMTVHREDKGSIQARVKLESGV